MKAIDTERGNGTDPVVSAADTSGRRGPMGSLDRRIAVGDRLDHEANAARQLGRVTGVLYLIIAVLGMFAGTVSAGLVVAGDPTATANNVLTSAALVRGSLAAWLIVLLADVAVAATLFVLLKPAGATLSMAAAAFRVTYAAIQGANLLNLFNALFLVTNPSNAAGLGLGQVNALALISLEGFGTGFKIGLLSFGAHLIVLGYLLAVSRYVPRALGILVIAAGIGYVADTLGSFFVPGYGGLARAVLMVPAVVGELALTFWLLAKGVSVRQRATTMPFLSARLVSAAGGVP